MQRPVRLHVNLPRDLDDQLSRIAAAPGVTKTQIVIDALKGWLNGKGTSESELRFAMRLDVISRQLARIEHSGHVGLETLTLLVLYLLTAIEPIAEGDHAARAAGKERFAVFIKRVRQRLEKGRPILLWDEDE